MNELENNLQEENNKEKSIAKAKERTPVLEPDVHAIDGKNLRQINRGMTIRRQRTEIFSGPLPPPQMLAQYNDIIPNGADRILVMAEKQESHRQYLEKEVIDGDVRRSDRGLIFGFILTMVVVIGGIYLIAMGHSVNGFVLVFVPLATLAGVFVYTKGSREKELKETSKTRQEKQESQKGLDNPDQSEK